MRYIRIKDERNPPLIASQFKSLLHLTEHRTQFNCLLADTYSHLTSQGGQLAKYFSADPGELHIQSTLKLTAYFN